MIDDEYDLSTRLVKMGDRIKERLEDKGFTVIEKEPTSRALTATFVSKKKKKLSSDKQ